MEEAIRRRKCVEEGIRTDAHRDGDEEMIYSNYFDLGMVMDYWGPERLNHHTEATTALFGARECARLILQEGLDNGIARHKLHGDALLKGIQAMGLETFGDLKHKMNNVLGVVIPQGVNGDQVRKLMLEDFGIEIGTSFGPLHGKVWRIGTMGYNARKDCVMTTLSALESVLKYLKFTTPRGRRCRPPGIIIAARRHNEPGGRAGVGPCRCAGRHQRNPGRPDAGLSFHAASAGQPAGRAVDEPGGHDRLAGQRREYLRAL